MSGERVGVPSVSIMTEKFAGAAELMGRVLGADGFPFVVIEHPISSASTDDLQRRARVAADDCMRVLCGTPR